MSLHTEPIPPARTVVLSNRRDGTYGGRSPARYRPGEHLPMKVDATDLAGQWLTSVDNIDVDGDGDGTVTVTASDTVEGCALFNVQVSADATPGDLWTLS